MFDVCEVKGYRIYGCRHCRAEHVFPMPSEKELKAYYDREQWFEGGEPGGYQDYELQTHWSVDALKHILEHDYAGKKGLSILDVGCGYGAHLDAAAALGWKCFGTEISDHARGIAQKRLGGRAYITEEIKELIPHEFDVVLILDVIEHLSDPYALFYSLFSIGAITPKTRVIITTPNAGSLEALRDPAGWAYRHPPSHLVYYRQETFEFLLNKIGFGSISVRGEHPQASQVPGGLALAEYAGLHVQAEGSNFTEFMRERYVPGTWSKIAEYEHLPRYALASRLVEGKAVLDFGCGTGYGSAVLAGAAERVLGLDIDAEAIAWAKATHTGSGAEFHRCDDLGASLPSASFDVVTCFEMIEHVDLQTQHQTIQQVARLLRDDGVFVISTPNPEVTSLYGANPYHLREMTREEFTELLSGHFPHIHIVEQRVRDSVSFESAQTQGSDLFEVLQEQAGQRQIPLAYIAFCSRRPLPQVPATVMFDDARDVVHDFLDQEKKKNVLRFSAYGLAEQVERLEMLVRAKDERLREVEQHAVSERDQWLARVAVLETDDARKESELQRLAGETSLLAAAVKAKDERLQEIGLQLEVLLSRADEQRQYLTAEVAKRDKLLNDAQASHEQRKVELQGAVAELRALKLTRWFRLRELLLFHPFGWRKIMLLTVTIGGGLLPRSSRSVLVPRLQRLFGLTPVVPVKTAGASSAYQVKLPPEPSADAPRVVHAIANFMTGGSSRLVIDLVEHLGGHYRQFILTSFNPDPPAYEGVQIEECRFPNGIAPLVAYFQRTRPDLVHVHYWGDCDEPWYAQVMGAARELGLPVVENVNTPVEPHRSDAVVRYAYVSDYVRSVFGEPDPRHVTVYPGSDFGLFTRAQDEHAPEDCVGMVYRLERDKLNEDAIQPFIHIARMRPGTRILIVGGGSLLESFQAAVKIAGLTDRFEFTGYVPYGALPDLYRRMSLFVAPVWKESFGQVAPFAMSMKVPVVGYDVGALGEIIGNQTLLAPAGDAEALAKIALRLLNEPQQRRAIAEAQQKRAQERFSVEAMIAQYAQLYAEVIEETVREERV